eukprot:1683822-Rhodomonas_salina.1
MKRLCRKFGIKSWPRQSSSEPCELSRTPSPMVRTPTPIFSGQASLVMPAVKMEEIEHKPAQIQGPSSTSSNIAASLGLTLQRQDSHELFEVSSSEVYFGVKPASQRSPVLQEPAKPKKQNNCIFDFSMPVEIP